jgi:hypothetical protein
MKYGKYFIAIALSLSIVFGGARPARAFITFDPTDFPLDILSQIWNGLTAGYDAIIADADKQLFIKEWIVDVGVKALVTEMKNELIGDTMAWMAGGFEGGGPLFVQNPSQYFSEAGDEASGAFLAELGNQINGDPDFFCRDFAPDIIFELGNYRRRQRINGCTINDVAGNLERFTDNFESGGFDNWFKLRNSSNNVIGFQLNLLDEQVYRSSIRKRDVGIETETGQGYKPVRECIEWEEVESQVSEGEGLTSFERVCKKYKTRTPGQAVADTIRPVLSSDIEGTIAADEISESLAGLINAAIQGAIRRGFDEIRN